MTEPVAENKIVTILGRDIELKAPTPLQAAVMGRAIFRALDTADEAGPDGKLDLRQVRTAVDAIGMFLDVMVGLVVDIGDRTWLESKIMDGSLASFPDLEPMLKAFDLTPQAPNRAARRATTRK